MCMVLAVIVGFICIAQIVNSTADRPPGSVLWIGLAFSAGLGSLSMTLFLFGQLLHIRAALADKG